MFTFFTIALALIGLFLLSKTRLPKILMSAVVTTLCYVGVVIFVTATFTHAIRGQSNQ